MARIGVYGAVPLIGEDQLREMERKLSDICRKRDKNEHISISITVDGVEAWELENMGFPPNTRAIKNVVFLEGGNLETESSEFFKNEVNEIVRSFAPIRTRVWTVML
jgi:hypothetical protein